MQSTPDRRLAAIVFTDIAGFTALSAEDEEKALSLIDQQRDLLKPIVEQFNGKWLKEMGDGLLLSFISTKQAVNCAIEIQKATKSIEGLNLRIGVHQGDILEKEGDVFGDDVNIASRIEPFAAVGGVAISGKINDDISGSPEITTKFVGIPRLKGVSQEVKIYCITSHGLPETDITKITAKLEKDVKRLWFNQKFIIAAIVFLFIAVGSLFIFFPFEKEVPSVGILYMDNRGSEEDEFWAQGITEDVIIEVASAGLIRVAPMKEILEFVNSNLPLIEIAGKLRVEYLLTSSIYKKVDGFDLRAQLIEVKSGKSIYANKWSESLDKSSTIIGTLADNILKSLGVLTKLNITKH
ncbi:adenylate/guanylate cyclase domain-containing protein, partial [candidate division KSB1 bacterium]|nr:adenylate/guanylate cyclase domain-containing protein [candidate division KSB1 bacterium]